MNCTHQTSNFQSNYFPHDLACQFFAAFARFEYAMKASRYGYTKNRRWEPDWKKFLDEIEFDTEGDELVEKAICFLTGEERPLVQREKDHHSGWEPMSFRTKKESRIVKAMEAAKQVRNNLFHGGKDTPHGDRERNKKLIEASLCVLNTCIEKNSEIKAIYYSN